MGDEVDTLFTANGNPEEEFQALKECLEGPEMEVQLLDKLGITRDGLNAKIQDRGQAICNAILPVCDGLFESFAVEISDQAKAQDTQMNERFRLASLSAGIRELSCSAKRFIYDLSSQNEGQKIYALGAFGTFVERVKTIRDIFGDSCPRAFVAFYDQIKEISNIRFKKSENRYLNVRFTSPPSEFGETFSGLQHEPHNRKVPVLYENLLSSGTFAVIVQQILRFIRCERDD
jgi:hypothetical protein